MASDPENVSAPSFHVTTHYTAASFFDAVGPWLREDEEQAALIIAASKASTSPTITSSVAAEANNLSQNVWIVCWSTSSPSSVPVAGPGTASQTPAFSPRSRTETSHHAPPDPTVRPDLLIMSMVTCAGPLPLLFYAFSQISSSEMSPRAHAVMRKLFDVVPPQHIAAIFGPSPLVEVVSQAWELYSGMQSAESPRRVTIMRCQGIDPNFIYPKMESEGTSPQKHGIARSMTAQDLDSVTDLCYRASLIYSQRPLTLDQSRQYATQLLAIGQTWVYESPSETSEVLFNESCASTPSSVTSIASFCEVITSGQRFGVIRKIFTHPDMRRKGCGGALLLHILQYLFKGGATSVLTFADSQLLEQLDQPCLFRRAGFDDDNETEWLEYGFRTGSDTPEQQLEGTLHW